MLNESSLRLITSVVLCVCATVSAQSRPAFEAVSIKPVPRPTPETVQNGTSRIGFNVEGPRVEILGYGSTFFIARAFGVEAAQVDLRGLGGFQSFDVQAKLPEGATKDQIPEMLQTMLAERFKLAYHRETREYPATIVTVGKSGMKLQRLPDGTRAVDGSTRKLDGITRMTQVGTVGSLSAVMNSFGGFPQMVDQTGLDGMYTWVRDQLPTEPGITYTDRTREAFEAMFEAAGLKLEARKVPKETIVVDRLEPMPTEN
ncbi:MAG: TIGR03435 family protein [Bryobacteraceae bacterium]